MNQELHDKIKEKLTVFLNREPTENEIINSQNDPIILGQVRDDEVKIVKEQNVEILLKSKNMV